MQYTTLLFCVITILLAPVVRILIEEAVRMAARNSSGNKQEPIMTRPIQPKNPKLGKEQPQKSCNAWEEPVYALSKSPTSRAKKVLNRSSLRQSLLINEILHRKY